jgi:hypothetical protein
MSHRKHMRDSVPDEVSCELSAQEDARLRYLGGTLRTRSPVIGAEIDGQIMTRVRRTPRARLIAMRAWWLRPRLVKVSPLGGLLGAAAAAVLLLVANGRRPAEHATEATSRIAAEQPRAASRTIQFVLAAPSASQVSLVGDFNGWDATATPLQPVGAGGTWIVQVPLSPGRHEYAFVINGSQWLADPTAPRAPLNEYGPPNSVVTVVAHRI